jgi:uncharacterized protein YyaL (SSP411 family)
MDAYETTGDESWLCWTEQLMTYVWSDFWDPDGGGLFDTGGSRVHSEGLLPARAKPIQDTPTPSPNGVAALVLTRLHLLTGKMEYQERSKALLQAFAGRAGELGLYAATYLLGLDWHLNPVTHIVVVGNPHDPAVQSMHRAALAAFVPRRAIQLLSPDSAGRRQLPAALRAMLTAEAPRGYLCTGTACSAPAADLVSWQTALESVRPGVLA